ncbi:hypothetical protein QVA66_07070 [Staphylococcus chromogenes]|nr:hypothetical protein [Staphylococcus chromogenes]
MSNTDQWAVPPNAGNDAGKGDGWALPDPPQSAAANSWHNPATEQFNAPGSRPEYVDQPAAWGSPQPQYPMQYGLERKGLPGWGIALLVLLVLALFGLAGWFGYSKFFAGSNEPAETVITEVVVVPPSQPAGKASAAPAAPAQLKIQPMAVPPYSTVCDKVGPFQVYAGSSVTSCPFATNVAGAAAARANSADSFSTEVYSPVTGTTYSMYCRAVQPGNFTCSGGSNAVVHLVAAG